MADRYLRLTGTAPGRFRHPNLGLPEPTELRRWSPRTPALPGTVTAADRRAAGAPGPPNAGGSRHARRVRRAMPYRALVFDATGLADAGQLGAPSRSSCSPAAPPDRPVRAGRRARHAARAGRRRTSPQPSGRSRASPAASARRSAAAGPSSWLRLAPEAAADSTLDFLLSPKSAYVSGPGDRGRAPAPGPPGRADAAAAIALVTGAARGIGEAIAGVARPGRRARGRASTCRRPADALPRSPTRLGGTALPLDITAHDAAERIAGRR